MLGELADEFNELSTKRIPELDAFKGDIVQWKFDNEWWSACHYVKCHNERCCKEDGAVYLRGLWCCCTEHVELQEEHLRKQAVDKLRVTEEALRLKPGSTVHDVHFNPDGTALLHMTFPSGVVHSYASLGWLASEDGRKA
jgi:hypothetical protein